MESKKQTEKQKKIQQTKPKETLGYRKQKSDYQRREGEIGKGVNYMVTHGACCRVIHKSKHNVV